MRIILRSAFALSILVAAAGCGAALAQEKTAVLLEDKVSSLSSVVQRPAERDALANVYRARDFRPIWFQGGWLTIKAQSLVKEFRAADDWGLNAADFVLPTLTTATSGEPFDAETVASIEFELSAAVMRYAFQARGGRIADPEKTLSEYIDRRPSLPEPLAALAQVSAASDPAAEMISFHPHHPQFAGLRAELVRARQELGTSGARVFNEDGAFLAPGMKHADITEMRRILAVPGDAGADDIFDQPLKAAVRSFQRTNKLAADGLVGPATRKALHLASGGKLRALIANMEAWRLMPEDLGSKHLFVNIPSFSLKFVDGAAVRLEERVIVGKEETPTPVFSKALSTIVLKPLWSMPDSIKREKLLAAEMRGRSLEDEGYVVKKGHRVVKSWEVDWNEADLRHYTFLQPAGDRNALGAVKFLFPNKFSVYLHDTPSKSLFANKDRAYSHGCVRLRNPLALAQSLLDGDKSSGPFDVQALLDKAKDSTDFALDNPVPIHIAYFTQWVNDDGSIEEFADVYGHAARLGARLKPAEPAKDDSAPRAGTRPEVVAAIGETPLPKPESVAGTAPMPARTKPIQRLAESDGGPVPRARRVAPSFVGGPVPKQKTAIQKVANKVASTPRRPSPGDLMNAAFRN